MPHKSEDTAAATGVGKRNTNCSADEGQAGSVGERKLSRRGEREWRGVGQTKCSS